MSISGDMYGKYTPPEIRIIRDAKIQAFSHPLVGVPPAGFHGGVVLGSSPQDSRLRHSRYWSPVDSFDDSITFSKVLGGAQIYVGPVYHHFGHTMAEFVHRIIPSMILSGRDSFILVGVAGERYPDVTSIPKFWQQLLGFFNIRWDQINILTDHTIIRDLFICEQGSDFGGGPKEGYLSYLSAYTSSQFDEISSKRIVPIKTFVSRSSIEHGGIVLGEKYLDELFREGGFHVMRPENMTLLEQMNVYRSSEVLIFSEGSACHGVELLGRESLGQVHLIERRRNHREIFRRVLEPRARSYSVFDGTIHVGSIVLDQSTGSMIEHLGVSLLNCNMFIDYVANSESFKLPVFSRRRYYDAALEDLGRYVEFHRKRGSKLLPDIELQDMWKIIDIHRREG